MIDPGKVALVLAAHGDRGSAERNVVLRWHALSLKDQQQFKIVNFGVLNGQPKLVDALAEAEEANADLIAVYPFFMSGGYFVKEKLPEQIRRAKLNTKVELLPPLGLDPALPELLLQRSLAAAREATVDPANARLLIVGHGSKFGRASAEATRAMAHAVRSKATFAKVETAFLEEHPFVGEALRSETGPTVVAGFFSGEGMHGHDDVPKAIEDAGRPYAYTRPIGGDPKIPTLIERAVLEAIVNHSP